MSSNNQRHPGAHLSLRRGTFLISLLLVLLLSACTFPGAGSTGDQSQNKATPTAPVTLPRQAPTPLPANHPVVDQPVIRQLPAGQPLPSNLVLPLTINLLYNDAALERTVAQIYTPHSPLYGRYLTPQQIRASFGPSQEQLQSVQQWFSEQGYRVVAVDDLATSLQVEASVATIERSLHLQLRQYDLASHRFFLPLGTPSLPSQIASLVQSIIGLNTFAIPRIWSARQALSAAGSAADCGKYGARQTLTRAKLAAAYQFDQLYRRGLQGQGMSIGILELNEPFAQSDVNTYFACAGLTPPQIEVVNVVGRTPPGPGEGEAALDIELAGSLAPQARLVVYQANQATIAAMLAIFRRVAAENRVQVLSVSYGTAEDNLSANEGSSFNQALRILAAEGISVFISSGDCGAFTERVPNIAVVSSPANAPYAIAVGGTVLQVNDHLARLSEEGWGRSPNSSVICLNDWGSGGGVSQETLFKRPFWQTGPGLKTSYDGSAGNILTPDLEPVRAPNGLRQVPDVAAAADNISIFWQGRWVSSGGTSAAAPIWAAGTALVDQGLRQAHRPLFGGVPTIYRLANDPRGVWPFTDIVRGENGFYRATRGWDYVTGWGSPNFLAILQRLQVA
ncbi:protease pro-enzyme activation domain-containing protein [Thermogemmatispora sp.]|uniref:S53 family peptidase n=1 Tax=Thermogemmatispora sp. TaxID=1968838 RepID=UPI0035E436AE